MSDRPGMIRVMVVDDHPIWRDGVARDLSERGFAVVATAADGPAALRIVPAARPHVVLMDLHLGGSSGVATTRRIIEDWPEVRVLVLSASGEHADVLAAVRAGASGYLTKTASVEELADARFLRQIYAAINHKNEGYGLKKACFPVNWFTLRRSGMLLVYRQDRGPAQLRQETN